MTTLAAWYAGIKAIAVTGTTVLAEPPLTAPSAKLPALFVDNVGLEEVSIHAKARGGGRLLKARVVVLMATGGQDRQANRWTNTIAMADTLTTALRALSITGVGPLEWQVEATPDFDGSGYWAVVANVLAREWT
jgi:hypothetical protein